MDCHKCLTANEIEQGTWKDVPFDQTPCAKCQLREDSYGTLPYVESCTANSSMDHNPDDEEWTRETADDQTLPPYSMLSGEDSESQYLPVSTLVSALGLILSLSLPARKTMHLRMKNVPYSEIGRRLGCTRQAAEKLVAQALAKQPLLQNLLPAKTARAAAPLTATRASAIADIGKSAKKRVTASQKPPFVPKSETRTA